MRILLLMAAAGAGLLPSVAAADPGGASEIYSPTVTRGLAELELRSGILSGDAADGDWQAKVEAGYGMTSWWRPALVGEWTHEGDHTAFTAFAIENVFDFTATRDWPLHLGAYVEYEWANDGPNELELKLLTEHRQGPIDLRFNMIATRLLGRASQDNWEFGYAAQGSYAFNDDFALGVQGFGDVGAGGDFGLDHRAQYWGPFAQIEAGHFNASELELQFGYLAGFGAAEADGVFRVKLEMEFGGHDADD